MTLHDRFAKRARGTLPCTAASLWIALCLAASPAPSQLSDEEIGERARSVLGDPSFQTVLPIEGGGGLDDARSSPEAVNPGNGGSSGGSDGRPSSSRPSADRPLREGGPDARLGRPGRRDADLPQLSVYRGAAAAIVKALFYVLVAVVVGVLLFALVSAVSRERRLAVRLEDEGAGEPDGEAKATPTLSELERLLRAGQLAEAVHLLLRLALENVEARAGGPLPASLTSREVLRRGQFGGAERESLATLVEAVERSLFGGLPVTRRDYETCAAAFERLTGSGAAA